MTGGDGDGAAGAGPPFSRDNLLGPVARSAAADAAAAVLLTEDGRYLLQHRDDIPGIFYPGHWGCFGGALDAGDAGPEAALRRELREELALEAGALAYLTRFDFDLAPLGGGTVCRIWYETVVSDAALGGLRLGEGRAVEALALEQVFDGRPLVPYDGFALWLHAQRRTHGRR